MTRRLGPLAALAMVVLSGAGCSNAGDGSSGGDEHAADRSRAMKFAACMRDNGIREFPDPDASGGLTIDGVVNGSSLDPNSPAWKAAMGACKDLEPAGFTGDHEVSAEEQQARLEFARCMRENGVDDFPDPVNGEPLVDTNRIPSSATDGGMSILNGAMHTCGDLAAEATGR
jgi:hypothetical protein